MTFEKGQKIDRGVHLTEEIKAKVIKDRKANKKWKDIAAELNIPVKRAMTYAKRKWYKEGMKIEKADPGLTQEEKKGAINVPVVDKDKKKKDGEEKKDDEKKDEGKDVVGKTKKKAATNIDQAVGKHIKKTDNAPNKGKQAGDLKKGTGGSDKDAKTGLSERKSMSIWFLVAIILVVATIGIIFLVLKPKDKEKAEYNKPVEKDEDKGGFEGRRISEL